MNRDYYSRDLSWSWQKPEPEIIPEGERPNFNDLQDHSEVGFIKRGITRYLFTRNPERSITMHKFLGASVMRKVIMGTYGRLFPRTGGSNYRTDKSKSVIEGSTRFAVGGSVLNEIWHLSFGVLGAPEAIDNISEGKFTIGVAATGLNFALVSLQRYNRARMVQRVNNELSEGNNFDTDYSNWLGLDASAVENYREHIQAQTPMSQILSDHVDTTGIRLNESQPVSH